MNKAPESDVEDGMKNATKLGLCRGLGSIYKNPAPYRRDVCPNGYSYRRASCQKELRGLTLDGYYFYLDGKFISERRMESEVTALLTIRENDPDFLTERARFSF
jgi:hypothetical protein